MRISSKSFAKSTLNTYFTELVESKVFIEDLFDSARRASHAVGAISRGDKIPKEDQRGFWREGEASHAEGAISRGSMTPKEGQRGFWRET